MILVTGANGNLGAAVLAALRADGARAVAGGSRTPGEGVRRLDFDEPAGLDLTGVSTLVLVSAGYAEDDRVVARHAAVLAAAARDGVRHVVYTSLTTAGDHLAFALAHRATERLLREAGPAWTVLRNGLYAELFGALLSWEDDGSGLVSPFGGGALAAVVRADLAEAAARVAADPARHAGRVYDLVGVPVTAGLVAERLGVAHRTVGLGEHREAVRTAMPGLLPFQPAMLASIATTVRHGFLAGTSPDLAELLGRPPRDPLPVAAAAAAASRPAGTAAGTGAGTAPGQPR
ncbi:MULTISPECIES: NmrA family transcriptional regulator [Kitasatospora]|uniref:Putative NmrA family protein n=1 Tax=Kitasatospora setae (strain ATCC 33774 / DSM 43861 / JCM 3304 / KCC A-0304 / NBRC 14216 / KM-6054) TaxID=452652 RepID=E4N742_KITSK|nr:MULTISPECIES: NmrA family transcriptional regulator [Kitasatospora]BAJ27023.1 putative NmrA family protein [Kitasatospora setae KM-6054]